MKIVPVIDDITERTVAVTLLTGSINDELILSAITELFDNASEGGGIVVVQPDGKATQWVIPPQEEGLCCDN